MSNDVTKVARGVAVRPCVYVEVLLYLYFLDLRYFLRVPDFFCCFPSCLFFLHLLAFFFESTNETTMFSVIARFTFCEAFCMFLKKCYLLLP